MIITPTTALLGILADVIPFAPDAKDDPHHGVQLEWTGYELRASATDSLSGGSSQWDPDDVTDDAPPSEAGYVAGPTREDEPAWSVFISLPDAVEIVKTFKVPAKLRHIPLHVKVNETGSRLIIERTRETGRTEHVMTIQPTDTKLPDVRNAVAEALEYVQSAASPSYWPHRLAAFANAGRRGPLSLRFTESGKATVVTITPPRFVGFVTPERSVQDPYIDDADAQTEE